MLVAGTSAIPPPAPPAPSRSQNSLTQSVPALQWRPFAQGLQSGPPQSTSVSVPLRMASAQDLLKAHNRLQQSKSIAETLLKNIHRLVADLRPSLLDDLGLVPAIAWYGEQRLKPLGIEFHLDEKGLKDRLPPTVDTALFRIVQEAMTNIVRHAQATQVTVRLVREGNTVALQVSDNGQGFDPQALQPSDLHGQGLGLRGMQERASILGGDFQMQTAVGKGTVITIRVPVSG